MKEETNVFGGKKIDNYIEVSNDPKPNISRPNVSTETLKLKKRSLTVKEEYTVESEVRAKKAKGKIIQEALTPEQHSKERPGGNSRSIAKQSTKKRSSKSFENLKKAH
jgi:hypothetical protein